LGTILKNENEIHGDIREINSGNAYESIKNCHYLVDFPKY
jgi:hypothetical protein